MANMSLAKIMCLVCLGLIIQGCAHQSKSLYYWGQYEPMIYDMYLNPGKADLDTQILTLSELIEKAESYGKKVPPGIYAHLGMAHAQSGNIDAALDAFNAEKELYPESTVFLDGIINRSKLSSAVSTSSSSPRFIEQVDAQSQLP